MKTTLSLALSCLVCAVVDAAETPPLRLIQAIPLAGVKGRFDHFAIDERGQRLFVAALGNNTLEVIDLAGGKRLRSLPGMSKPTGVLYLPEGDRILIANGDDGALKIVNGFDYKAEQTVMGLDDADNLRFDFKRKLVWLGYGDGALGMISPGDGKLLAAIKLPAHPESFQLEPDGVRIFVNLPDAKRIGIIDRERRAVDASWPMEKFQANFPMALDIANHRLFVGCRQPPRMVVFDTEVGKPVADVAISGDTDDLFYDARRKRIYVSCGAGFIDTIEQTAPNAYKTASQLPTASGARTSYFSANLDRFYLAVPDRRSQQAEVRVYQPD